MSKEKKPDKLQIWRTVDLKTVSGKMRIDLYVVTPLMMGFQKGVVRNELFKAVTSLGPVHCPMEVRMYLREKYSNQPLGEWIRVAEEETPLYRPSDVAILARTLTRRIQFREDWIPNAFCYPGERWLFANPF